MKPVVVPDEKRELVLPVVLLLQRYNPSIGHYERSIFNSTNYVVKLSNGRISLKKELIDDFQLNPSFISEGQLRDAASAFTPVEVWPSCPMPPEPKMGTDNGHRADLIVKYVLTAIALIGLVSLGINFRARHQHRDYVVYGR